MEKLDRPIKFLIKEMQEEFPKEFSIMYDNNQFLLEDLILKCKEHEDKYLQHKWADGWLDGYEAARDRYQNIKKVQ